MDKHTKRKKLSDIIPKYTLLDVIAKDPEEIEMNITDIDDMMEYLSKHIGRSVTDEEQFHVLDIVDEYTPKNRAGNFLGPILPFRYAWQIYLIMKHEGYYEEDKKENNGNS
ncbi:MAG: hypothetical protein NTZ36_02065 [Candidatus Jorgensenbacteria bacterium]|nr:hypothetical protein [Candidatus Jorgensenbacteria bacterium]